MVVLVNGGTASSAEILTGALRDRGRAVKVVGEQTFGKGVFQEVEPLSNGGTLNITVGGYYLPDGENLADNGIKPTSRLATSRAPRGRSSAEWPSTSCKAT